VQRYNLFYSADINGNTVPGVSSGQMIEKNRAPRQRAPAHGFAIEWTDLTYQQILAGDTLMYIFPLCVIFVFLVLAAQYESWSMPIAIILIVPMCLPQRHRRRVAARAATTTSSRRSDSSCSSASRPKTPSSSSSSPSSFKDAGMDRVKAAVEACRLRLRPILMTSFAFILGVLPSSSPPEPEPKCARPSAPPFSTA
jgi:multidrug efflux pump subunit AcrB